jgi:hypothetical protein
MACTNPSNYDNSQMLIRIKESMVYLTVGLRCNDKGYVDQLHIVVDKLDAMVETIPNGWLVNAYCGIYKPEMKPLVIVLIHTVK